MPDYKGKLVLAPMVRVSELPMRALSLRYGADLVWSPEIIDKKIVDTRRVWNEKLQTIDFVHRKDEKVVFRTLPTLEKSKLVFQMGTADPDLAVRAATVVANDVCAIDVNSGCPKHFSVHSGMGAALLQTPDKLVDILESLVESVGKPFGIDISVKIRVLDSEKATYDLVDRLVKTGVACITVHCRTTPMRPREPAFYDYLAGIVKRCRDAGVFCYVNGDVHCRDDLAKFQAQYDVDGAMIARGAEQNPSCFRSGAREPVRSVASEFVELCQAFEFPPAHAKYCLTKMISGKDSLYQSIARSKTLPEMAQLLKISPALPATGSADPIDRELAPVKVQRDQRDQTRAHYELDVLQPESKRVCIA